MPNIDRQGDSHLQGTTASTDRSFTTPTETAPPADEGRTSNNIGEPNLRHPDMAVNDVNLGCSLSTIEADIIIKDDPTMKYNEAEPRQQQQSLTPRGVEASTELAPPSTSAIAAGTPPAATVETETDCQLSTTKTPTTTMPETIWTATGGVMSESITASSVVGVTAIVSVAAPTSPACAPSWGGRTTLDSGPSTLPIVGEEVTAIRGGADPCGVRSFDDLHIERGLYAGTRGGLNSSGQGQDHVGLRALTPLLTAGQDGCYPEEASPKSAVTGLQFSLDVLRGGGTTGLGRDPHGDDAEGVKVHSEKVDHDAAKSRQCVDALAVTLTADGDGKEWHTSTLQLQLACLSLCETCRSVSKWTLTVTNTTPTRLWAASERDVPATESRSCRNSRVPLFTPVNVVWWLSPGVLTGASRDLCHFSVWGDEGSDMSIDNVVWPPSMTGLDLLYFARPVEGVSWPATLRFLGFGDFFDQPIAGAVWPEFLQDLHLGGCSYSIDQVVWPATLRCLTLGRTFNEPIDRVVWPASLVKLTFGMFFNQPIDEVHWPALLLDLKFGRRFNQPFDGVAWPASLQRLTLGAYFKQPISKVEWPTGLETIAVVYPRFVRGDDVFDRFVTETFFPPWDEFGRKMQE